MILIFLSAGGEWGIKDVLESLAEVVPAGKSVHSYALQFVVERTYALLYGTQPNRTGQGLSHP